MDRRPAPYRVFAYKVKTRAASFAAVILLRAIDVGLSTFGYKRTCRLLIQLSLTPTPDRQDTRKAARLGILINRAARDGRDLNCIRRSLALWWALRWLRLPSRIVIGIDHDKGHAWVEHGGEIVNDFAEITSRYPIILSDELIPETVSKLL